MKQIPLTQGKFAIVDDADFDVLIPHKWHYTANGYAGRNMVIDGKKTIVLMHKMLNETPLGHHTDHINGNRLDNRRSNLRTATASQNLMNCAHRPHSSKYKGASWDKSRCKWEAHITINRKKQHLGRFESEEDAGNAYNAAALKEFGAYARLNNIQGVM